MAEKATSSGLQPEKPTETTDDDAKQSSRTHGQIPLCTSGSSSERPYKVAKKDEDTTKTAEQATAKHGEEDEESDNDLEYAPELSVESLYTFQTYTHRRTHVKLQSALAGERYGLPGVGDASNDFAVPTAKFGIQDIVGRYLVRLQNTPTGGLAVERKKRSAGNTNNEKDSVVLSRAPVCHLLDRLGKKRTHGNLEALADEQNFVRVYFHQTKSCEEWFDVPCANTDDISTPETPSPVSPSQ